MDTVALLLQGDVLYCDIQVLPWSKITEFMDSAYGLAPGAERVESPRRQGV